jgi:hypothetical protein
MPKDITFWEQVAKDQDALEPMTELEQAQIEYEVALNQMTKAFSNLMEAHESVVTQMKLQNALQTIKVKGKE